MLKWNSWPTSVIGLMSMIKRQQGYYARSIMLNSVQFRTCQYKMFRGITFYATQYKLSRNYILASDQYFKYILQLSSSLLSRQLSKWSQRTCGWRHLPLRHRNIPARQTTHSIQHMVHLTISYLLLLLLSELTAWTHVNNKFSGPRLKLQNSAKTKARFCTSRPSLRRNQC